VTPALTQDPHPLLHAVAFEAAFSSPLGALESPAWLQAALAEPSDAISEPSEGVRAAIRALLRHGGFKPSGRSKPASESLLRDATLPAINVAVDIGNVVSRRTGIPVSIVDLDRVQRPLALRVVQSDEGYVFNPSGQEIRLLGLLCLHDAVGPCANAVKDSMRTKTHAGTHRALFVVWGARALASETESAADAMREQLERCGARVDRWG